MSDQSHEAPQVETVDVPPNPEILLGWARRLFESEPEARVSVGVISPEWEHQRTLWLKSYEMYQNLPQPTYNDIPEEFDKMFREITAPVPPPEATLALLSDVGPILGCPADTRPERAEILNVMVAQWWQQRRQGPLILPFPVDVRDLRG